MSALDTYVEEIGGLRFEISEWTAMYGRDLRCSVYIGPYVIATVDVGVPPDRYFDSLSLRRLAYSFKIMDKCVNVARERVYRELDNARMQAEAMERAVQLLEEVR